MNLTLKGAGRAAAGRSDDGGSLADWQHAERDL